MHKYDDIVHRIHELFEAIDAAKLRDSVAKGGIGEILLAHRLRHQLATSDKGCDGIDYQTGKRYEYKVSITDQFNFHFGARKSYVTNLAKVGKHFSGIEGVFIAHREEGQIKKVAFIRTIDLVPELNTYFSTHTGSQLNRKLDFAGFTKLSGARVLPFRFQVSNRFRGLA